MLSMKLLINKMDVYFLSDEPEEITLSDRLWLYGGYGIVLTMCLLVGVNVYG